MTETNRTPEISGVKTKYAFKGGPPLRLKELQINSQNILNIDTMELSESCVIVISDGKAKVADLPSHAEVTITTYKGKVTRVNWDEGEAY